MFNLFKLFSNIVRKCRKDFTQSINQERQTRQNSGGVGEVTKINATTWVNFLKKVHFLAFLRKTIIKDLLFLFLRNTKVHFLAFLPKSIKKSSIFKNLNVKKGLRFRISTLND